MPGFAVTFRVFPPEWLKQQSNFQMAAFTAVTVPRWRPTLAAPAVSTTRKAPTRSDFGRLSLFGLGMLSANFYKAARRSDGRVIVKGRNYEKNIRGKKGPAERKQAKLTAKHLRLIVLALKEGGPDPSTNNLLSRYIKAALKDNLPRDTIDRRIKAFTDKKESFEEVEVQGYGPGGAALIIEAMTDNMNRTRGAIKDAFKEVNGEVKNVGDHIFARQGVLEFEGVGEEKVFEDIVTRDDGVVEVTTLPELFHKTVAAFEDAGLEPSKSEVQRRVQVEASLNHEQSYEVLRLLHELEECDDIGEVHHNAVFADDCELQYGNYGVVLEYSKAYKK